MLALTYQQNSFSWRIELLKQRLGEWWELLIIKLEKSLPDSPKWDWNKLDQEGLKQLIKLMFWSIVAALAIWLTWQLWLWLRPHYLRWLRSRQQLSNLDYPKTRPTLSTNQWVIKSREYQKQRDYRQAIFCLYQAMIQQLSDRQIINNSPSRTDGEYISSINQLNLNQVNAYELLLSTHEKLCFSRQVASKNLWDECQRAFQNLTENNSAN